MPVLTCRIDEALHRRVKAKLSASGRTFQDLIANAVRGIDMAEPDNHPTEVPVPVTIDTNKDSDKIRSRVTPRDKWERAHNQLREIENSTDEEAQGAILSNLSVFSRTVRGGRRERKNTAVSAKGAKPDILDKVPGALARKDNALAGADQTATVVKRNRGTHNGNKPRDQRSGTSGRGGSKG